MKEINDELYTQLKCLGIINNEKDDTRNYNIGESDYSKHIIQPWSIWLDYNLDPFDADIIKRVLRHKRGELPQERYNKIIHICKEKLRQIEIELDSFRNNIDFEDKVI